MDKELFDKGMKIRREMLGDAYVDRALARIERFQQADAGTGHRILLGLKSGAAKACRGATAA